MRKDQVKEILKFDFVHVGNHSHSHGYLVDKSDAEKLKSGELKPQGEGFKKPFGKMFVPVYSNVGISTEKRLQGVVDTIFTKGEAQVSITNVKH